MKGIAKILLVGAVAVMAIAVSAAPSEAKHKKMAKGPAPGTFVGQLCSTGCDASKSCKVMVWGPDMKWSPAALTPVCASPMCPAAC
jgi:hypothetical protein